MKRYCLLTPDKNESFIRKYYLDLLGIENTVCIPLWFKETGTITANEKREWFKAVVEPKVEKHSCEYILVCDADYFKTLSGKTKAEPCIGYVYDCVKQNKYIAYIPTYKTAFKDPIRTKEKINLSINAVLSHSSGSYEEIGSSIIKYAEYPKTNEEIKETLKKLMNYDTLTCDIETWSLKHYDSGITSICFCWDKHSGVAFKVDFDRDSPNERVRMYLRNFFIEYKGKLIFHNITFDCYILTYQLFMNSLHDFNFMLFGMDCLLKNFDDTKLIAYLATNSCAGNQLGLKALAHEYAGDWAEEEITNIDAIDTDELLKYNLTDGLSTWFIYEKYYPLMVKDNQKDIYERIFKPACKDIIQMQLTGLPIDMNVVLRAEQYLLNEKFHAEAIIKASNLVKDFMKSEAEEWVFRKNQKLKKKQVTVDDFKDEFNPASNLQLKRLLFNYLELPIVGKTTTGEAATSKNELEKILNQTEREDIKELLKALIDWKDVSKILTAFIPAFKKAKYDSEMQFWFLYGKYNLGGTVSGRLSSNDPNLQNIPATGSKYAHLIKECFRAPKGWLFIGLDYNALEDRISALTTKDPEKIKVYTEGFDSHCLRAYTYFKEQMSDITEQLEKEPEKEVEIINSIKSKHKDLRQKSKGCTFALTYNGTASTLIKNLGFKREDAKRIYDRYHELYHVSDEWVNGQLESAEKYGYVTCAFGLRVRTPRVRQTILGTKVTPQEAEAEKRTAANALGQSWCLLTTRAGIEVNEEIRKHRLYKTLASPCGQIHDCQYFLLKDDVHLLLWLHERLLHAVEWQEDPMIAHPDVHLGGELSLYWPSWADEISIPNHADEKTTLELIHKAVEYHSKMNYSDEFIPF